MRVRVLTEKKERYQFLMSRRDITRRPAKCQVSEQSIKSGELDEPQVWPGYRRQAVSRRARRIRAVSDLRVNGHYKTLSPLPVGCAGHSGLSCSVYSRDNLCPPLEKPLLAQCEYLSIKSLIM
jgi:hypothetical protein